MSIHFEGRARNNSIYQREESAHRADATRYLPFPVLLSARLGLPSARPPFWIFFGPVLYGGQETNLNFNGFKLLLVQCAEAEIGRSHRSRSSCSSSDRFETAANSNSNLTITFIQRETYLCCRQVFSWKELNEMLCYRDITVHTIQECTH